VILSQLSSLTSPVTVFGISLDSNLSHTNGKSDSTDSHIPVDEQNVNDAHGQPFLQFLRLQAITVDTLSLLSRNPESDSSNKNNSKNKKESEMKPSPKASNSKSSKSRRRQSVDKYYQNIQNGANPHDIRHTETSDVQHAKKSSTQSPTFIVGVVLVCIALAIFAIFALKYVTYSRQQNSGDASGANRYRNDSDISDGKPSQHHRSTTTGGEISEQATRLSLIEALYPGDLESGEVPTIFVTRCTTMFSPFSKKDPLSKKEQKKVQKSEKKERSRRISKNKKKKLSISGTDSEKATSELLSTSGTQSTEEKRDGKTSSEEKTNENISTAVAKEEV